MCGIKDLVYRVYGVYRVHRVVCYSDKNHQISSLRNLL
jgi:hypothetical protein